MVYLLLTIKVAPQFVFYDDLFVNLMGHAVQVCNWHLRAGNSASNYSKVQFWSTYSNVRIAYFADGTS